MADLLRIKGDLLLMSGAADGTPKAERCYVEGLEWARKQGALSWELRCATSLFRLWNQRDRAGEARELLASVYGRFTEGFETADLKAAQMLLNSIE